LDFLKHINRCIYLVIADIFIIIQDTMLQSSLLHVQRIKQMQYQGKSRRKFTGGRLVPSQGKRKYEIGREAAEPHLDRTRRKIVETMGGNSKVRLFRCDVVNVTDPSTNSTKKASIETVVKNSANQHYVRRNILTKGSVIRTDAGNAKITSRPGQDGVVNAVLIQD
jgi:small subunit ribosomal protein S8e